VITEAVVLSLLAAVAGVSIASGFTSALVTLSPTRVLRLDQTAIDGSVLAFTVVLSIATGMAFGIVPAFQASAFRAHDALKEGAVRSAGRGGARLRDALAVAQVAVALVLLTGAGLLLKSFMTLQQTRTGIDTTNLLTFDVALSAERAEFQRLQVAFYEDMLDRIRRIPGVRSAGAAVTLPIGGDDFGSPVLIEGQPDPPPGREASAGFQMVSTGYFDAIASAVSGGQASTVALKESTETAQFVPTVAAE
jgi:putative ABC transport system permease protein